MQSAKPTRFVRDATGLVREISPIDAFFANLAVINLPLGMLTYTTAPYVFPGSDPVLATLLATVLSIFPSLMYTLFTWAMPRSGGEYVYVSRVIHPVLGFIANFSMMAWFLFFAGILANWMTTLALAPSVLVVGTVTSNQGLVSFANNVLSQNTTVIAIGLVVIAIMSLLMGRGVRATVRAIRVMMVVMLIGVIIAVGLLLTNTHASFINDFNTFASYNQTLNAAHQAGYSPVGSNNLLATIGVMPFAWFSIGFGVVTSYFAGEVREVKKNALYSQLGSTIAAGIGLSILGALAIGVFGYDFLGSMTSLSFSASSSYPLTVSPYFNLFVSMLTTNPLLLWVLAASYIAGFYINAQANYLLATRSIFAWSFDRVIPTKFADLNKRLNSPVYAVLLVAIINALGLVFYTVYSSTLLALESGDSLGFVTVFIITSIAGIVFPYAKKTFFESSPANIKVGGVPLITISGVISLIFYSTLAYFYVSNPLYGANIPIVYETIGLVAFVPLLIFVVAYYYRKGQGINLMDIFREIPPE